MSKGMIPALFLPLLQAELPADAPVLKISVAPKCGITGKSLGRNLGHAHSDPNGEGHGTICIRAKYHDPKYPSITMLHELAHISTEFDSWCRRRNKESTRYTHVGHGRKWHTAYQRILDSWGYRGSGAKYACDDTAHLDRRSKEYKARYRQIKELP